MAKKDIRTCRFINCKHDSKSIDISKEKYVKDKNNMYYHSDCFELKKSGEWKDKKTREELVQIRDIWGKNLNPTVNYPQLMKILNEFVARGISSEYLLFTVQFCIKNSWNLKYPGGLKYYIDREEIKTAYSKKKAAEEMRKYKDEFKTTDDDNTPKFNVKKKPKGFQTILR